MQDKNVYLGAQPQEIVVAFCRVGTWEGNRVALMIFQPCPDGLDGAETLRAARQLAFGCALNLQS